MRFLIIFTFLISNCVAAEIKDIKNLVINKELKKYDGLTFFDDQNNEIELDQFEGNLVLLNFWATWCAPCKKELPKLDVLDQRFPQKQLNIVLINIENIKYDKIQSFFEELKVKNLVSYFDIKLKLTKELKLRGLPITLIVNSQGKEIVRIIGDFDFIDPRFINWVNIQ